MDELDETDRESAIKPRRRISWLAWLTTLIVAACLLVMNVRGVPAPDSFDEIWPKSGPPVKTCSYDHGWPMTWMRSSPPDTPAGLSFKDLIVKLNLEGNDINSDLGDEWAINVKPDSIQWGALLVDVVLAILVSALVFVMCKKRWGSEFRFNLLDIGVSMAIVSLPFSYYQYHNGISRREQISTPAYSLSNPVWSGPVWLRKLVGNPNWMEAFRHCETLSISMLDLNDKTTGEISKLPYLRKLSFEGDPNREQIELLGKLTQLEVIDVEYTSGFELFISKRRGNVENVKSPQSPHQHLDETEEHESRIKKPNVSMPSVIELRINSKSHYRNEWPRAVDLIDSCPNLKIINLTGDQYLTDDLMNLPDSIERIEYGFLSTGAEVAKLQERFPNAKIERKPQGGYLVSASLVPWSIAKTRVNRRRKTGWTDSKFQYGTMDLSSTEVDQEFLSTLSPVFHSTDSIIFGAFDSPATAVWLAQKCPKLAHIDTNGFPFGIDEAMQLPTYVRSLAIDQHDISVAEFSKLIDHLQLERIRIRSAKFEQHEIDKLREASPNCVVNIPGLE